MVLNLMRGEQTCVRPYVRTRQRLRSQHGPCADDDDVKTIVVITHIGSIVRICPESKRFYVSKPCSRSDFYASPHPILTVKFRRYFKCRMPNFHYDHLYDQHLCFTGMKILFAKSIMANLILDRIAIFDMTLGMRDKDEHYVHIDFMNDRVSVINAFSGGIFSYEKDKPISSYDRGWGYQEYHFP